jgi:hypothetical protein
MTSFTPLSAATGGALIGLASALLMLFAGRIAGISGILGATLGFGTGERAWRLAFIAGLILAPVASALAGYAVPVPDMPANWLLIMAPACWSASAHGSAAAAPRAMACAESPGCPDAQSSPPPCSWARR